MQELEMVRIEPQEKKRSNWKAAVAWLGAASAAIAIGVSSCDMETPDPSWRDFQCNAVNGETGEPIDGGPGCDDYHRTNE